MLPFFTNFIASNGTLLSAFNSRFAAVAGDMDINTNAACGTSGGSVDMVGCYDPTFKADQEASGILVRVADPDYAGLALRCGAPGSGNGYWWLLAGSVAEMGYLSGGAFTVLATTSLASSGDTLRFRAIGTSLLCYINGVLDTTVVDATYATGVPGVAAFRNGKNSGMGNLTVNNVVPDTGLWDLF